MSRLKLADRVMVKIGNIWPFLRIGINHPLQLHSNINNDGTSRYSNWPVIHGGQDGINTSYAWNDYLTYDS